VHTNNGICFLARDFLKYLIDWTWSASSA